MKKFFAVLLAVVLTMGLMVGCTSKSANDELVVYFVPSRDPSRDVESATSH